MFGFSPGKLLLLALVFLVVWYGWKYTRRVDQIRRALREEMERSHGVRLSRRSIAQYRKELGLGGCGQRKSPRG